MEDSGTTDIGLARRALNGDKTAFGKVVAQYEDELIRLCFVITGDAQTATEAVQNAWQKAWRKRGQLRAIDRFRPWLIAVACNEARMLMRRDRRARGHEQPLDTTTITVTQQIPDPDLAIALATLSAEDRQLIALRFLAGFNSQEIGATLGLSGSGVRTRLARALTDLRKELIR